MNAMTQPTMTLEQFLAWENDQAERHEFYRGEVFGMVGGRRVHGRVVSNLDRRLQESLEGSPCQAFVEGMKIQIADDTILYPDLFVTSDKTDLATDLIFRNPILIIEVLSPSTQGYDRSQKFALYRRISSLREYILIDPEARRIEAFRIGGDGQWVFQDMSDGEVLEARSVDARIPIAQVFAGIEPPADEAS
jgi:Uma2 family endonuclease